MKQSFKTVTAVIVASLLSFYTFAQDETSTTARWVSDKGYWVIENNIKDPLQHTIWFYNNDNVLLYKELLTGVKLNPHKRKIKMKLKKVLESAVTAWEKNKNVEENKNYVTMILR
jgi:hypothetical protein